MDKSLAVGPDFGQLRPAGGPQPLAPVCPAGLALAQTEDDQKDPPMAQDTPPAAARPAIPTLDEILACERAVWEALVQGDAAADAAALSEDFVGLYPTGFSDRDDHVGQLSGGATVARYRLSETRLVVAGPVFALLAYRADYRRPDGAKGEVMYVSSLWRRAAEAPGGWVNLFSQDTPAQDGWSGP